VSNDDELPLEKEATACHMGAENQNRLPLRIQSLNLNIYIFVPLFPHKHAQMLIELKHIYALFD
jgi:hypothetical protein